MSRRLRPVAIQSDEGQRLLATVPEPKRLVSAHAVLPSGETRSAGAAAEPLVRLLPGGRPLALIVRLFPRITERAYRYVADHRDRFARLVGVDSSCQIRR